MASNNSYPLHRLFPNIVTMIGLCFGLFGLKYAIAGKFEFAVGFIVIAAFIDGLDGRLARMLNASSPMGAQLDSLADFFNFSVAPALILYMWKMHEIKGAGWAIALFFIICGALRLARFNVMQEENAPMSNPQLSEQFFTGIPAPVGAGLSLVPMMLIFMQNEHQLSFIPEIKPWWVINYTAVIGLLMISRLPSISVKKMTVRRELAAFAMAFIALFIVALIIEPWIALPAMGLMYLISLPVGWVWYLRVKKSISS